MIFEYIHGCMKETRNCNGTSATEVSLCKRQLINNRSLGCMTSGENTDNVQLSARTSVPICDAAGIFEDYKDNVSAMTDYVLYSSSNI